MESVSGVSKLESLKSQQSLTSQQLNNQNSSGSLVDADFSGTNLAQICDEIGVTDHFESFAVLSMPPSTMSSTVMSSFDQISPSSVANQVEICAPPPTLSSVASQFNKPQSVTTPQLLLDQKETGEKESVKSTFSTPSTSSWQLGEESRRNFTEYLDSQNAGNLNVFPENLSSQIDNNSSVAVSNASSKNDLIENNKLQKDKVFKTVKTPKSILKKSSPSKASADEKPTTSRKKIQKSPSRPSHGKQVSKIHTGPSVVPIKNVSAADSSREKYPEKMRKLVEMGFKNTKLNRSLLEEFDGNLNGVVNALVTHLATTDDGQFHA